MSEEAVPRRRACGERVAAGAGSGAEERRRDGRTRPPPQRQRRTARTRRATPGRGTGEPRRTSGVGVTTEGRGGRGERAQFVVFCARGRAALSHHRTTIPPQDCGTRAYRRGKARKRVEREGGEGAGVRRPSALGRAAHLGAVEADGAGQLHRLAHGGRRAGGGGAGESLGGAGAARRRAGRRGGHQGASRGESHWEKVGGGG